MSITIFLVTLHILGAGLVVGVVFLSLWLLYLPAQSSDGLRIFQIARNAGSVGAGLAILSGIILAARYRIPLIGNYLFDAKLILVLIDGLIAQGVIKRQLARAVDSDGKSGLSNNLRAWAWLSVLVTIAIVAISVVRAKAHV